MMIKLKYKYYAVNSDNKIVCGFNLEEEAVNYANKFRYRVFSGNNLKNKGIDSENFENWSFALFNAENIK
jgi:hypothetical protein